MVTNLDIRRLAAQDIPEMRKLFRATVLTVNSKDYTKEEVEDWASCGDSVEHWKELLAKNDYIGALDGQGGIVGFSSMNAEGYLHSVSITARPFFEKRGYKVVKEQKARANRLWLTNYVMKKTL